jgi:hypothetical protein
MHCTKRSAMQVSEESLVSGVETLTALARGASVATAQGDMKKRT